MMDVITRPLSARRLRHRNKFKARLSYTAIHCFKTKIIKSISANC